MKSSKVQLLSGILIAGTYLVSTASVMAQSTTPEQANNNADAGQPTNSIQTSPPASQPGAPAENTAPGVATNAPGATSEGAPTVTPGPLEEARKILITRIRQAKDEGIGTANYMMAFNALEDSVKAGQSAEQLKPRVESLARALHDQLEKAKILKTQRPVPVSGPSGPDPGNQSTTGGPDIAKIKDALTKNGTGDTSGLLEKLKEKFGGNIPNIPDGLKDRIPKDILNKLGQ